MLEFNSKRLTKEGNFLIGAKKMKLQIMNYDGRKNVAVNVSAIVGHGGQNRKDDVMLIQGLFKYIAIGLSPNSLGLGGEYQVPDITGDMDGETSSAIVQFQITNAGKLLGKNGFADSRIHPADYNNRHLHSGIGKRYMAITYLHLMANDSSVMQGHFDYVQGLAQLSPELARYIDLAVINA